MTLKSGTYIISSKSEDSYVGRNSVEDKSLHPKRVVVLPQGIEAPKVRHLWEIEALPDEIYILRIGGGFAAEINKLLFAVLIERPEDAVWKIVPQPREGEHTYTILLAGRPSDGWFVGPNIPEGEKQIAVHAIPVGLSLPPVYPTGALFRIVPA
ncbi:hypothetical protein HYPSUDRAFT_190357 [Hypholoma sublateritium FD-334 SS-4]|uniref:Serine protease inhibitor n=1 Tax=Hypholoma sublateritium (strain FD-334 SS-4) TaxID=945553 RepID=A0A0D2PFU7_HYPSF|nr:hypothetical protein HYPSUDRAFT_190357 [Hypholoma sublateritium FD-334 SS-4]